MSEPLDWESVGGYLHRCTRCESWVVCVRPNEQHIGFLCPCGLDRKPRLPFPPLRYVGTLADYLGVGTGVLVSRPAFCAGKYRPALLWQNLGPLELPTEIQP